MRSATASAKPSTLGDSSGGPCPGPGSPARSRSGRPRAPPPPAPRSGRPGETDGAGRWGVGPATGQPYPRHDAKCAGAIRCARGHTRSARHRRSRAAPPGEPGRPGSERRRRPGGRHAGDGALRRAPHGGRGAAHAGAVGRPGPARLGPRPRAVRARRRGTRVRGRVPRPAGGPGRPPDRHLDGAGAAAGRPAAAPRGHRAGAHVGRAAAARAWSARCTGRRGISRSTWSRRARPCRCRTSRASRWASGGPHRCRRAPSAGFEDLVPIGQARVVDGAAVCLWALERYPTGRC